jgi:hypothetical protein
MPRLQVLFHVPGSRRALMIESRAIPEFKTVAPFHESVSPLLHLDVCNRLTVCELLMTTKPSERIVVFVTPAQKLAISKTADNLGISVSELMRRAVLNFNATSEQIKAAGIVDRLRAPKAPDALDVALKSVAAKAAAREARAAASAANTASKATAPRPPESAAQAPDIDEHGDHDDDIEDSGEDAWMSGDGRS